MNHEDDNDLKSWYSSPGTFETPNNEHVPSSPADADLSPPISPPRSAGPSPYPGNLYGSVNNQTLPQRKGRKGLRIAGITLFVVVLIAATALFFSDEDTPAGGQGSYPFPFSSDEPGSDSYRDFFDYYYGEFERPSGNTIPRAETVSDVSLSLLPLGEGDELTLQQVYEKCAPSVVAITADVDSGSYYWGTGVIMTADGYIITNTHVLDGTSSVSVTLYDDSRYVAKLVGADSVSDIAVLKIEATGLTPAEFGDSSLLSVGDSVVAIGNPLGEEFRGTMTNGIVSAINRDISYNGHTMTLMQTNAAINEGNSGGPLINMHGQVIGITNMKMMSSSTYQSVEGIGFAIPTATMKPLVDSILRNGEVTGRPALGITVGPIPEDVAGYYDLPNGLYITQVSKGSDAEAKGVRAGDILTAVNGIPVSTTAEVSEIKDGLVVGDTMTLTLHRDGKIFDVDVLLVETSAIY